MTNKGAENQHYVPKIMLRNFLSNEDKERVSVYDMKLDRSFVTHIKGIMAERRFNEFIIDEQWRVSFEKTSWQVEELVKPTYLRIIRERKLSHTPEDLANISTMLAFQFLRTKAHRNRFLEFDNLITNKLEQMGFRKDQLEGYEPLTEDSLKRDHFATTMKWLRDFSIIISEKVFLLAEAAPGRHFYLGDNPVVLNNHNEFRPYGNLGLNVTGIEIYLPLCSDLLLCAWCPSILNKIKARYEHGIELSRKIAMAMVMQGKMPAGEMKSYLENASREDGSQALLESIRTGMLISTEK